MDYSPSALNKRAGMLAAWSGLVWPIGVITGCLVGFAEVNSPTADVTLVLISAAFGAFVGLVWAAILWSYLQVKALSAARLAQLDQGVPVANETTNKRAMLTA